VLFRKRTETNRQAPPNLRLLVSGRGLRSTADVAKSILSSFDSSRQVLVTDVGTPPLKCFPDVSRGEHRCATSLASSNSHVR
jgi:hypothetical protein